MFSSVRLVHKDGIILEDLVVEFPCIFDHSAVLAALQQKITGVLLRTFPYRRRNLHVRNERACRISRCALC